MIRSRNSDLRARSTVSTRGWGCCDELGNLVLEPAGEYLHCVKLW